MKALMDDKKILKNWRWVGIEEIHNSRIKKKQGIRSILEQVNTKDSGKRLLIKA